MIGKKRFYTLDDIKKQLVYTPSLFILLISCIAIFLLFLIFNLQQKNEIQRLNQEQVLNNTKILQNYISTINQITNTNLDNVEISLSNFAFEIKGLINNDFFNSRDSKENLKLYLNNIEINQNVDFVIFDTKDYNILHGKNIIEQLRLLTNSKIQTKKFTKHMLKNIEYIGDKNLIYWMDNQKRNIQLSYFIKSNDNNWFIGVFSKIDDMKNITKKTILKLIDNDVIRIKDAHLFFYDKFSKKHYNFYNKKKIATLGINTLEKNSDKNLIYEFKKYNFLVGVKNEKLNYQIESIKLDYERKFIISLFITIFIAGILIISSNLFGKFLNKIFRRYNHRLERKNYLQKKWKERYELAIIASNDGLWDLNLSTNEIFFSKKWLDMYGYNREDISSFEDWINLIHKDERQIVQDKFDEHLEGKTNHLICEYRLKAKDGKYNWVLIRGKAFKTNNEKRVLLMSMNINDRVKLIKDLKNIELLTDFGRIAIFRWKNSENLDIKFVSKSIESYGYKVDDFLSKKISYWDFVYENDIKLLKRTIQNSIEQKKESFTHIFRVKDLDGEIKWVYNRNITIKDDYGKVIEIYGYINDITKMKLHEEDLKNQIKQELEKNLHKDRLLVQQTKLASMGEMLGNIAHQWRQPLNNVNLLIHLIRDSYNSISQEKLNEIAKSAKFQIDYMSQTIDDFRDFYKPTKDKKIFSIKKAVEKSIIIVNASIQKNDFSINVLGDDVKINSYENEFEQVVVNIINNAIDASKLKQDDKLFKPFVNIEISKTEDSVYVEIFNNCGNIPKDIIERIFEPYFTTKFEEQGTGIGLYMSKVIVENNMKGKIEASNKDDGVLFILKLPI